MASFPLGPRWAGLDIDRDGVGTAAAEARQLTRAVESHAYFSSTLYEQSGRLCAK
jgi:hypothetical protein